jgi:hypothetical protein
MCWKMRDVSEEHDTKGDWLLYVLIPSFVFWAAVFIIIMYYIARLP